MSNKPQKSPPALSDHARLLPSFGRRRGRRLRTGKQDLFDNILPKLEIALPESTLNPASLFSGKESFWLEIGFGGGEHLAHQAALNPDVGHIGGETYINGIGDLLKKIDAQKLDNIRIFTEDARLLIEKLPDACLEKVFVLYPDPWPKSRHHKRRIVSTMFLNELARVMKKGGELRFATDYADYATWMLERLLSHDAFTWTAKTCDDWLSPWADWISTRYEQKALAGRPTYITCVRR